MIKERDPDKPNPRAPHPPLAAYYARPSDRDAFVRGLFDRSARHYDRINLIFSGGLGNWYRRRSLHRAGLRPGMRVLDAAIGTGAIARQALRLQGASAEVIGLDVSAGMLAEARRHLAVPLVQGRMEELPLADGSIDFLAIGYALRHVPDLDQVFGEIRRVLRPGGLFLALEIGIPQRPARAAVTRAYMSRVIPRLSGLICRSADARRLMDYYWDTITHCVAEEAIVAAMARAGLAEARCTTEFGLFRSYTGHKELKV